jgi:hypothetical protein
MQIIAYVFVAVLTALSSLSSYAHEFWIEPSEFQPRPGVEVTTDLVIGTHFLGSSVVYTPGDIAAFAVFDAAGEHSIKGRYGDRPAGRFTAGPAGLSIVYHQTQPLYLDYDQPEKFIGFATKKGFLDIAAAYDGASADNFVLRETYRRFAKSLIAVDGVGGPDRVLGAEVELVALTNPYATPTPDTLDVAVYQQGVPRSGALVTVYVRHNPRKIDHIVMQTDAAGQVTIPLQPGRQYLVDSVVLQRPADAPDTAGIDWESLWASLTFAVPGQ